MKAIVLRAYGDTDCLTIEHRPVPEPAPGEITINVAFAGVGFVDTLVRTGVFPFAQLPLTPGFEVSGIVRAIGEGVTAFSPGQHVAAMLTDFTSGGGMGGYAEVARAKAALTITLQKYDDLALAAATIVNGATAFMAFEGLRKGAIVTVSGASGGLGQCLIAAAAYAGAEQIIAISGNAERAPTLKRLGATEIVSTDDFIASNRLIDAAFDTVGGPIRLHMARQMNVTGRLVLLGNVSGEDVQLSGDDIWLRSLTIEGITTGSLSALMPDRVAAAAQGATANARTRPTAFTIVDLDQAGDAHRMIEDRRGPGKVVLRIS